MAEDTGGEKSLPPSAFKLQKAREDGNVARSQDLSSSWALFIALAAMYFMGRGMLERLVVTTRYYFGNLSMFELNEATAPAFARHSVEQLAALTLPFALVMLVSAIAFNIVQIGPLFSPKALKLRPERLNPFQGFKKFVSPRTAIELIKSILKVTIVSAIVIMTVRSRWEELLFLMFQTPAGIVQGVAGVVGAVWLRAAIAMLLLGILDFGYQFWQHRRELRMTVQEAREEMKQLEGDPKLKARIRGVQRQMAMQRMMADVPTADVIITNPIRFAVALRYNLDEMQAPVVIAKGARLVAARIRELAIDNDVPIIEKPELARTLFKTVDVGQPIPEDLFAAVAEVLAFVYKIDQREEKRKERASHMNLDTAPTPA